ncbi:MAG: chromosome segregation protein SMC [Clostridia bacterium]|nr:chromosome segregation protein SMC [Clostridia bacterium]
MFLKALEIQGFKSFPDKTRLDFGRGITAIVGPNGSGKSNIVDAIRWVLGEQSVKTLRGGKMEDVIFGGTLKRSAQGFCQVSLLLDNSDHGLSSEYDEVEVTRRYYRSGDSEFYINKKAVRLKDVHELFMDTGVGRDGYSVIGQGRIDEILSVKSVDRREIFEEASGISKFRYRKEESERKLDSCEENLVRVRDIITELEGQVEPLREQSEKAKAFLKYRDEMRVLEVSLWLLSLEKLKDNLQKARVDFENAERMLSAKKDEVAALYERAEKLTRDISEKQAHEDELRESKRGAEESRAGTDSEIAVINESIKNNEKNIEDRKAELSEQEGRGKGLAGQKEELLRDVEKNDLEIKALEEELADVSVKLLSAQKDGDAAANAVNEQLAKIREQAAALSEARARLDSLTALFAEIESSRGKSSEEIKKVSDTLAEERKKAAKNEKEIAQNEEKRDSAQNMIKGFELRLESRLKKLEDKEEELSRAERELAAKIDRKKLLEALERDYEGFSQGVKRAMTAKEKGELTGLHAPLSFLITADDKYALAIETALGSAAQDIVVDREEDGQRAINYLKRVGGRASFKPLTAVKDARENKTDLTGEEGVFGYADELLTCRDVYRKLIKYNLGTTAVCTDIACAVRLAKKYRYAFRIATLDGQLITPNGTMTGGTAAKNTGILSRANELKRLESETAEEEKRIAAERAALAELKRELEASRFEADAARNELREAEDALLKLNAEKAQHKILLDTLESRESELTEAAKEAEERLSSAESRKAEAKDRVKQAEESLKALEDGKAALDEELEKSGRITAEYTAQTSAVNEKSAALRAKNDAVRASVEQLDAVIAQMSGDARSKEEMIAETERRNEELRESVKALAEKRAAFDEKAESIQKLIEDSVNARLRTEGERARAQKEAQSCNEELLSLERERSRLESKKIQTENEENVILDKMWENYELTRTTAAEIRVEIQSVSASQKRVSELRSSIKKLGDVNVGSIEEYQKVNERYTFLTAQRDDLEKAKVDLLKVIDDLTRNMKTIFSEQFKLINEEFGRTFVEIFGGGSAKLLLEDEDDILNCGIEIKVEMPGKSMRAISLLSGGEKAFVAIALYFAVIKVRPTPFCVLDEIEAALDDVNVLRYADYMRRLCSLTQFIVITHRRGTMEGADILYGVTMPEQGVTKLLAININEVEEKIKLKPN